MNNFRNTLGCHKHYLIVLAIISVVGFQNHSIWRDYQHKKPFQIIQDVSSYYAYLPGLFVHKSIFFKEPVSHDYWLRKGINGKNLPKFTMGMAFMYSPFFIAAHAFALHSEWFEADGLSYPYSLGLELGTFFYFAVGLFFLMKTLNFFFAKEIVSITILALFFGSNLLYYVLAKSEMPHAYLFSLFSVIISEPSNLG